MTQSFTIRYRRPQAPWSAVHMVVPGVLATSEQIKRLKALGYSIIDIEPKLPNPLVVPKD